MRIINVINAVVLIAVSISLSGCGKAKAQRFKSEQLEPRPEASVSSREEALRQESTSSTETLGMEIFNVVKKIYSYYNSGKDSQVATYMKQQGYSYVDYGQNYYSDALGEEFVKGGRMQINKGQDRHFVAEKNQAHSISTCIASEDGTLVSVDVCFYNDIDATGFLQSLLNGGFSLKKMDDTYGVIYKKDSCCMTCSIGHEMSWDRYSKDYEEDFSRPIFIFTFYSEHYFQ